MNSYTYQIGFAPTQIIPADQVVIVEVSMAQVFSYIDVHEHFVQTLTEWAHEAQEGQQLVASIDGPVSIGAILMALDSLSFTSLDFWLGQAGLCEFRVMTSDAVFDFDELLAE